MKIHSNLEKKEKEKISGPPSNLCRLPVQICNRSAIWLSLFLQHSKMRVADKSHYFTILENWRRFMKVLRNMLNDNKSAIKKKLKPKKRRGEKKGLYLPTKSPRMTSDMSFEGYEWVISSNFVVNNKEDRFINSSWRSLKRKAATINYLQSRVWKNEIVWQPAKSHNTWWFL